MSAGSRSPASASAVEVYTYNADHGFQCDERDSFAPEAAQIAWGRTLRFIDSHM
jgi:carboxymethylenebutenolidase